MAWKLLSPLTDEGRKSRQKAERTMNFTVRFEEELDCYQFKKDSCLTCPHAMNEQHLDPYKP